MKTVKEAQTIILKEIKTLPKEYVSITDSLGRILAEVVSSNRNHPPYDVSAMDGYAVRYADIKNATRKNPAKLEILEDIKAGGEPKFKIGKAECSRIMTGAPMPVCADTVVRVEDTDCKDKTAKIFIHASKGENIRPMGENLKTGEVVLNKGHEITPSRLGIMAMVKKKKAQVYKRPRVAILSTGDELEGLDEPFNPKKIPDANSYTIMAGVKALGGEPVLLGIARDTQKELEKKLKRGLKYDALIVSGGVAVGHYDFVRPAMKNLSIEMKFWRVALRPGHPFAFGIARTGKPTPVFALPGNPVSTCVCFEQFISPAIRKMMGAKKLFRRTIKARLKENIKDKKGRTHFMRAILEDTKEGYEVRRTGGQGSGILMSMINADGLLIVPKEAEELKKGSTVTIELLHEFYFQENCGLPEEKND